MDLLTLDALGEAMKHTRAFAECVDDAVADGQVILCEIQLGVSHLGEIDAVRVGDPHAALAHVEVGCGTTGGGHRVTSSQVSGAA